MTDTDPNKEQGERPASNQTAAADRSGATEGEKSAPASPPQESMTPERGETSGRGEQASQPRKPQIGDTRPAPANAGSKAAEPTGGSSATGPSGQNRGGDTSSNPGGSGPGDGANRKRRRRRGRGGSGGGSGSGASGSGRRGVDGTPVHSGGEEVAGSGTARGGSQQPAGGSGAQQSRAGGSRSGNSRGGNSGGSGSGGNGGGNRANPGNSPKAGSGKGGQRKRNQPKPVAPVLMDDEPLELDEQTLKRRSGKSRKGRAVGRYQMNVHVSEDATQISILEGRALLEHYVSRPSDDIAQIHGNIYVGKVENVLPGMEAAFVDISTPKNAVLYRGDVQYDQDDVDQSGEPPRIEDVLKAKQLIVCQVTKNPIAHKGARLTQEVSLPGRFVVLVPNSKTYGISKRLADDERKRLRKLLDRIKPEQHGVIVRTAASGVTTEEIERDVARLVKQWDRIEALAAKQNRPSLL
ncbi:MAG TPA: ribonuclease E/G, partial [Microthrixaceae bacterium]|nr:ribonuclease E/G [Microthrixaceae bacterium]